MTISIYNHAYNAYNFMGCETLHRCTFSLNSSQLSLKREGYAPPTSNSIQEGILQ